MNSLKLCLPILFVLQPPAAIADENDGPAASTEVRFKQADGKLTIMIGRQAVTDYVFRDSKIPRPYFAHVKSPDGVQVTRHHPPVEGTDPTDHADMHPGIWLAFGDLGGADFWRNRARVNHVKFLQPPAGGIGKGSFAERKEYVRADGTVVCQEDFRCEVRVRADGYLLVWDSTFHSDQSFYFGDQEEMGLGVRVATPLSEIKGGQLRDADGRSSAKAIWSQSTAWCDYSGEVDGKRAGMTVFCHPKNFRLSWMHARDYGLMVANPFGRKAMQKGDASRVEVQPAAPLRLRYAVWVYSKDAGSEPDAEKMYREYAGLK